MRGINKILALSLIITSAGFITSCNKESNKTVYDNEKDALIFATQELDGVFNPFYYSTAPDGEIVGMTQISMFTTDKEANIAYGADEPVVVLDYEEKYDENTDRTTYTFVLKNPEYKVKYSNGSYVTMRDVLFNMYEYLDPQYTGSSTMYSTDIIGLQQYRTQEASESGQENFEKKFTLEAEDRVSRLVTVINEIKKENGNAMPDLNTLKSKLQAKEGSDQSEYAELFVEDFDLIGKEFKEELTSDYNNNIGTYLDYDLEDDIQTFFYVEGLISIDLDKQKGDPERIEYNGWDMATINSYNNGSKMTKEQAIEIVFNHYYPNTVDQIANYWATATEIRTQFVAEAKDKYFKANVDRPFKTIEGIKVITKDTVVNGKTYPYALYNSDGTLYDGNTNGYEMLSITIDGVDPKAIWNFSFSVAPMYYYSNSEQIAAFNYGLDDKNPCFGVEYGSNDFQNNVIKHPDKLGLPMGGGAYKATTKLDGTDGVKSNTFFDSNVVYFERNENFVLGAPKIKKIRYQVVSTNNMLTALQQGQVHYCSPSATPDNINKLNELSSEGLSYAQAETLGYGYIGINAKDVPSVYARRAIMHAMNTSLSLDYYKGNAEILYRPMSKVSWAYPTNAKQMYVFDSTGETSRKLLEEAGYRQNSQGKMVDENGNQFKLTFTIAGETDDHPTAATFFKAEQILDAIGCDITVKPDVDALSKLNEGGLAVWAAAWSTTIDPDMYQTYHIDSTATSVTNWGYPSIKADTTGRTYWYEQEIINELSDKIDAGRETLDRNERKAIYAECLDLVMELAVELPTYQRDDLFAYNSNVIDKSTMTPANEVSPYNGPINEIWNLSLVTE